jgi:outer membrane protein TolC
LKLVENYNKQGMIQKSDLLNAMVRVQEVKDQYQSAKTNVKNASDYVSFFMNEPIGKIFQPIESIDTQIIIVPFNSVLNENRKDIQAMQGATDAYRNMYQMNQYSMVPRINAFGAYEMNDKNLVGFGASNYIVGVQMAWNIFDGNKSISKTKKSKLEYMKAKDEVELYKTQNQLELNKTIRQLEDLSRKVNLTNLSHKQSKEAYSIRKNRFDQGLEKTSDLLQSETLMFQKELEYLQAVFEYNYTKKYLQFLTL